MGINIFQLENSEKNLRMHFFAAEQLSDDIKCYLMAFDIHKKFVQHQNIHTVSMNIQNILTSRRRRFTSGAMPCKPFIYLHLMNLKRQYPHLQKYC
jgi:hypothetical protein